MTSTKQQAKWVRLLRWLHRKLALIFFLFIFLVTLSGVLLGIKKPTGLLAPTQKGVSSDLGQWLPIGQLREKAAGYLRDSVDPGLSSELDRIDIRPDKGIAKFIYKNHYWGLQLDGINGRLLSVERRSSDFIESLHDGSILDKTFDTGNDTFKAGYSTIMGICLILLLASGFWLWYGPKRIRKYKRNLHE